MLINGRFIFPFCVQLSGKLWTMAYGDTRTRIRVLTGMAEITRVLLPESERPVNDERKWIQILYQGDEDLPGRTVCLSPGQDLFMEEVKEPAPFTRIDVFFEIEDDAIDETDVSRQEELRDAAFARAQWFIRSYRVVVGEVDVPVPALSYSPIVELAVATRYVFRDEEVSGSFRTVYSQFQWPHAGIEGLLKKPLDDKKTGELVERLNRGNSPPLHMELLLEAKELAHVHQNYRLSAVVTENAFEAYVQQRLRLECDARQIHQLPGRSGVDVPAAAAIEDGDLRRDLLRTVCEHLTGASVVDSAEHHGWFRDTYELRNEIIHRGRMHVSGEEAQSSFEAALAYLNWLDGRLRETRS